MSRMMRDSILDATAKAMREGMFAFITPVIMSAEGRCVAMTDVYKRQQCPQEQKFLCVFHGSNPPFCRLPPGHGGFCVIVAVSYTHLDVYKRQFPGRSKYPLGLWRDL